jgi:acetyl esterase
VADPGAGRPGRARLAVLNAATGVMLPVLKRLPDPIKRLMLGRRSITIDGNTLDTTLQLVLAVQRASGVGGLVASDDLAVARGQLRTLAGLVDSDVAVGVRDISIPGPAGAMRARHYIPVNDQSTSGPEPLLVFFHGGGFVIGDLETHDGLCRLICRDAGVHVVALDYRLAPEHKAPAAIEDCYAAYRWAVEHAAELGADPQRVAVGGDSAGGNLATVVSRLARDDRDQGVPLPALQLLIYPATNFAGDSRSKTLFADGFFLTKRHMDWFRDSYLTGATIDSSDPRISPLLADDLAGLPPALLLTAGFDPLRDEGDLYAEALTAAGVAVDHRRYGSMVHAFTNFFALGGGSAIATADMVSALKAHLSRC